MHNVMLGLAVIGAVAACKKEKGGGDMTPAVASGSGAGSAKPVDVALPAPTPANPPIAVTLPTGKPAGMESFRKFAPGGAWKELDANESFMQWSLDVPDKGASFVFVHDCRAAEVAKKSVCTEPYPLQFKGFPARRWQDINIHIRAGHINVSLTPGGGTKDDETLLPLANAIDLAGLSKL